MQDAAFSEPKLYKGTARGQKSGEFAMRIEFLFFTVLSVLYKQNFSGWMGGRGSPPVRPMTVNIADILLIFLLQMVLRLYLQSEQPVRLTRPAVFVSGSCCIQSFT